MLDQRRSFSFSSFDFNSSNNSASLFSSSSSDDFFASNFIMYDTEDDDGDNDDGAYIEINLDPPRSIQKKVREEKEFKNSNSSEVELRISFSSTGIPPTETTTTTACGTTQHAQGTTTTTTTTMSKPRRGRLFVSLARIVNEFVAASSVKTSNSVKAIEANNNVAHENGPAHVLPLSKSDCAEMIRTRKDCTMVPSKNNGIMNFIVKLKYKNIPSMLISMVTLKPKNGQIRARQPLLQRGRSSTCRGRDPMNNNNNDLMKLKTCNHSDLNHQDVNHDKSTSSSVAGIINFKTMRGVLDALIVKTSRYCTSATTGGGLLSGNKHDSSKSCPSSIKSSPMHSNVSEEDVRKFYSRDNSVQAAIAHCKKSFGTQAEFDFHI